MAALPISAVDAVAPALERMKQLLFQRFRLGLWLRLLLIGLLTGEFSSSGGWLQGAVQFPALLAQMTAARGAGRRQLAPMGPLPRLPHVPHLLPLLLILAVAIVVIGLIFMYLGTVLRFVLLEAVVNGRVRLAESFGRWHAVAGSLFLWRLLFSVIVGAVVLLLMAGPVWLAWRGGFLPAALRSMLPMIAVATLLLILVGVLAAVIWVLVKDFAVPLMALEGLGAMEACRRLIQMVAADPGAYAGYIGMKMVLAMAVGFIGGIVFFAILLVLGIPAVVLIVVGIIGGGSMAGHAAAITAAIVLGALAVLLLLVAGIAVAVASLVFFQAYVLQFFAGRYERLAAILFSPAAPLGESPA